MSNLPLFVREWQSAFEAANEHIPPAVHPYGSDGLRWRIPTGVYDEAAFVRMTGVLRERAAERERRAARPRLDVHPAPMDRRVGVYVVPKDVRLPVAYATDEALADSCVVNVRWSGDAWILRWPGYRLEAESWENVWRAARLVIGG